MPSSYPTGLDAFTTGTLTGVVSGSDHGNKADAINKIEAELGISPSGGAATVAARFGNLPVNVMEHGAVGNGTTNDSAAIAAAVTASGWPTTRGDIYFPPRQYHMDSTVTINAGGASSTPQLVFHGHGASFACDSAVSPMFSITNTIVSATFVKFLGCQFYTNFAGASAILLNNAQDCEFNGCLFTATGSTGIKITGTSTYNKIVNCSFYTMRQGIEVTGNADHLLVQGNAFMEGLAGTPLNWIEINGASQAVVISGNTFDAIDATLPIVRLTLARNSVVSNNTFYRATTPAVEIGGEGSAESNVVSGNTFRHGEQHDIVLRNSKRNVVQGNTFFGRSTDRVPTSNTYANIRILDQFTVNKGSFNSIIGNQSLDPAADITNVVEADATCNNNIVIGNSGLAGFSLPDTSNVAYGNIGVGTTSVASATTIAVPGHAEFVTVTGTTTITSVTASWVGRVVTLMFSGALTFTDGSNLKLAGNLVTTADDTITLKCDGTNWYEMSRSVN